MAEEKWRGDWMCDSASSPRTERTLKRTDLDEFVPCFTPRNRHERVKSFAYDDLLKRDLLNLDIFWLRDESLARN
jgi:type I restriction enzyme M protein